MRRFSWRTGVLFVVLLLPVLIYLFLQSFGENHFTLPVYYADGKKPQNDCGNSTKPHVIPAFQLQSSTGSDISHTALNERITIVAFSVDQDAKNEDLGLTELLRLESAFRNNNDVQVMFFFPKGTASNFYSSVSSHLNESSDLILVANNEDTQRYLARCAFFINLEDYKDENGNIVLIDENRQIRGYYNLFSRKDVDRLILETKILLHEHKINKGGKITTCK